MLMTFCRIRHILGNTISIRKAIRQGEENLKKSGYSFLSRYTTKHAYPNNGWLSKQELIYKIKLGKQSRGVQSLLRWGDQKGVAWFPFYRLSINYDIGEVTVSAETVEKV